MKRNPNVENFPLVLRVQGLRFRGFTGFGGPEPLFIFLVNKRERARAVFFAGKTKKAWV